MKPKGIVPIAGKHSSPLTGCKSIALNVGITIEGITTTHNMEGIKRGRNLMDEAMLKSGKWPNVAIPAGSDPARVMERYGVKPCMSDADEREPVRVERTVDDER